jgi:hypothetical protein
VVPTISSCAAAGAAPRPTATTAQARTASTCRTRPPPVGMPSP